MRTALRTATALALAIPLIASAVPASASSTFLFRERGSFADVYFEGATDSFGKGVNYALAQLTVQGDFTYGFVDLFDCDAGETPWGDENGENVCDYVGYYDAQGDDTVVMTGKGKDASTTISGTVDLYEASEEDYALAVEDVPFEVTLTPTGGTSRIKFSGSYRDHETGESYRWSESRVSREAIADGYFDGIPALGGAVGTYRVSDMQRIA